MSNQDKRNALKESRKRQRERRDAINLLIKEKGLSYNEAAFVVDGGTIPTETIDNAEVNLTLERVEIEGSGFRDKAKKYKTIFVDQAGNKYNANGELIESVVPTSGTTADVIRNARAQRLKK